MPNDAIRIRLFGRPTICYRGREVTLSGQEELLFVALALRPNRWVDRETLIRRVWEDESSRPPGARVNPDLATIRHRLARTLGELAPELLEFKGSKGRLHVPQGAEIDTELADLEVRRARDAVVAKDWISASDAARRVNDLIRDQLAVGREEHWLQAERKHYSDVQTDALQYLAEAELHLGPEHLHAARDAARELIRDNSCHVYGVYLLMVAEYRCGDPNAAQEIYQTFCRNCGITPPSHLRELTNHIAVGASSLGSIGHVEVPTQPSFIPPESVAAARATPTEAIGETPRLVKDHCGRRPAAASEPASSREPVSPDAARLPGRGGRTGIVAGIGVFVLIAAAVIAIVTSLRSPAPSPSPRPSASAAAKVKATVAAKEVALKALVAFVVSDWARLRDLIDDGAAYSESASGRPDVTYNGRTEVISRLRKLRASFSMIKYEILVLTANEERVTYRIRWSGKQVKPFPPSSLKPKRANDGKVRFEAQIVADIDEGKITGISHTPFADKRLG